MASEEQGLTTEELEGQQNMFSAGDKSQSKGRPSKKGPTHLKGTRALERLRNRIELAVNELNRLRDENHALHKEVESLKSASIESPDGTAVVFSEGAAELRTQIESYISVIDGYLEREASSEQDSSAKQEQTASEDHG